MYIYTYVRFIYTGVKQTSRPTFKHSQLLQNLNLLCGQRYIQNFYMHL